MPISEGNEKVGPRWGGLWLFALVIATLPVLFGLYQVWIFFDQSFPHLYHSRTVQAWAAVAWALAGIGVPLWIAVTWREFRRRTPFRQWARLVGIVLLMAFVYLLPVLWLMSASREARAVLSYTPQIYLNYLPGQEQPVAFSVTGGDGTGSGGGNGDAEKVVSYWNASIEPKNLRDPDAAPQLQLRSEATLTGNPLKFEVSLEVDRTVVFDTRGLADPRASNGSKPVELPVELPAGTHQLTIEARPASP